VIDCRFLAPSPARFPGEDHMGLPHRIKVKYFVADDATVELPALTPIFHRWIQQKRVDGLLLDVADYKHVPNGPGILLIGHEADYSLDLAGGRPGLVYDHKREWQPDATLAERIRLVFDHALSACDLLETEEELGGRLQFKRTEAELTLVDRLNTPNQPEVLEAVIGEIQTVLDELYGPGAATVSRASEDPRRALAVHIQAANAPKRG
jgi:hypothetical protein